MTISTLNPLSPTSYDMTLTPSIRQEQNLADVTYFHLEFDEHAVIWAEGAPSESFVDEASRDMFDNAEQFHRLYPHAAKRPPQLCAPRVEEGWALERIRLQLAEEAGVSLQVPPTFALAGLHAIL